VNGPGPLSGLKLAVFGCSWGLCWRSGDGLGTYVGDLELLMGLYGRSWADLGSSTAGLGSTWAALGADVDGLGPLVGLYGGPGPYLGPLHAVQLLGPMLAVLGRTWALCCRSWVALGAHVGSLGVSWGLSGRS